MKKVRDFYQISLKLILKNKEGKILALKADDGGSYAGFYDFPGGRIDTDEFETPFSEIIKREAEEEIGEVEFKLKLQPVAIGRHLIPAHLASAGKEIRVLYVFFEAEYVSGEVKISPEHTGYDWFDLSKENPEKLFISGILQGVRMYLG
ncbi:NUDIX domain-containing protein [Patescibacteria group bacterium]|nr:NUDIX domain-containing protein [Patescibacteria group bacterium]MCG2692734.1 NUDIX domain-containing protein [Candidatus Parcubacteria bacterium]